MKFVKGQWYVIGNDYYEYNEVRCTGLKDNLHWFRKAGELNETPFGDPIATPASLTPDLSDAPEFGDCFNVIDGVCKYRIDDNGVWIADGRYNLDGRYLSKDTHPTLFNSFAQFISYWDEWKLNQKGGTDA